MQPRTSLSSGWRPVGPCLAALLAVLIAGAPHSADSRSAARALDAAELRGGGIITTARVVVPTVVVPDPADALECQNTVQGAYYLADSKGRVCARDAVVAATGCCGEPAPTSPATASAGRAADRKSRAGAAKPKAVEAADPLLDACRGCDPTAKCCADFEFCVACCLYNSRDEQQKGSLRSPGHPERGTWATDFDACKAKCRTNSKSTTHENAYIAPQHHCYGSTAPVVPDAGLPQPSTLMVAAQGQSCAAACEARGEKCSLTGLRAGNTCTTMRSFFTCVRCDDSFGGDQPAYVMPTAPAPQYPRGACLINDPNKEMFSCDGAHQHTKRLCACAVNTPPVMTKRVVGQEHA